MNIYQKSLSALIATSAMVAFTSGVSAQEVFNTDFGTASDGFINEAANWNGQPNWTIASGNASFISSFQRAENFTTFRIEDGESLQVVLTDVIVTGTAGSVFSFGFANSPEHTGAQTPQVDIGLTAGTGTLSIGNATDTAYANGSDLVNITLDFARSGSSWSVTSSINNTTDSLLYNGVAGAPDNDFVGATAGSTGFTTIGYMDDNASNVLQFGMRGRSGTGGDSLQIGGISATIVPEPSAYALLAGLATLGFVAVRRRK
ncbi:MAG: PEP-CTERM sorting domain-containing protein [Opitutaceae bacterium]